MNKKVLTLCTGLFLAGGMNAFAAPLTSATAFETGKAYVLSDGINVLAVEAASKGSTPTLKKVSESTTTTSLVDLQKALWRVVVTPGTDGTEPTYTFVNVYTGTPLAINSKDATKDAPTTAAVMGGDIVSWNNNPAYNPVVSGKFPIYHNYTTAGKDSAYVLVANSSAVGVQKVAANVVSSTLNVFKVEPVIAPEIVLNAKDLNTNLHADENSESFKLTFNPDVQNNQWANVLATDLKAEDATAYTNDMGASSTDYVTLADAATGKKSVYVDTAYVATDNVEANKRHLRIALAEKKYAADENATGAGLYYYHFMENRSKFKFTYFATNDSIVILSANAFDLNNTTDKGSITLTADGSWRNTARKAAAWGTDSADKIALATLDKFVKLTYLTEATASTAAHSEITVGAPEAVGNTETTTLRTRISLGMPSNLVPGTPADGVYLVKVVGSENKDNIGRYYINNLAGKQEIAIKETRENYLDMPATQWVVTSQGNITTIKNREFASDLSSTAPMYKSGDNFFYLGKDTLEFIPVGAAKTADKYLGYKYVSNDELKESVFTFNYLHELLMDQPINTKFATDSVVWVDKNGESMTFSLERLADDTYGYTGGLKGVAELNRTVYYIKVTDASKLENNGRYLVYDDSRKQYVVSNFKNEVGYNTPAAFAEFSTIKHPTPFFLKENNEVEGGECYYTFVVAKVGASEDKKSFTLSDEDYASYKVSVDNNTLALVNGVIDDSKTDEVANSAFAVIKDESPLYRRFNNAELGENENDAPNILKFYRVNSTNKEYLYEDANSKYSEGLGINFLGVEGKGDDKNAAMYVDTAYVNRGTRMPQYMLVLNPQIVKADTVWCNATSTHKHETLADSLACPHTTITEGSVTGRYLINLQDSVDANTNIYQNKFQWNKYTRLAFIEAKHVGDTLFILDEAGKTVNKIRLDNNKHKNVVFSFRYVNNNTEDFLIESETENQKGENVKNSALDVVSIAPSNGGWVKIQNGVPVIANDITFSEASLQAEVFNTEVTEDAPTANETIAAGNVIVAGANGAVVVKGAEGKSVIVSTILGKVVANEVLTSDNAQITAPAGVVVVSVDGESFKVVVK